MFEHLDDQGYSSPPELLPEVARAARQRRQRRRWLTMAVSTAVLLVAGTVLIRGTRLVGTVQGEPERLEVGGAATSPTSPPRSSTSPTSQPSSTGATPDKTGDEAPPRSLANATPAQAVPSNITWKVLDANSPEATEARLDRSHRFAFAPALPVENGGVDLYEQVNGSWHRRKSTNNDDDIMAVVSGDAVYGIGSVPGGARLSFGTFDAESSTWQLHDVPEQIRPYESDNVETSTVTFASPVDGGMIASVWNSSSLRSGRFPQLPGYTPEGGWPVGPYVERNTLVYFVKCNDSAVDNARAANPALPDIEVYREFCTEKRFDATELGLSPADVNALGTEAVSSLWKITANSMVPFTSPDLTMYESQTVLPDDGLLVNLSASGPSFTLGRDGTVTKVFGDLSLPASEYPGRGQIGAGSENGAGVGITGSYLLTAQPGAPTQVTNVLNAVETPSIQDSRLGLTSAGTNGALSVAIGTMEYNDPGNDATSATLTDAGYSLVISDDGYQILDKTGTAVPTDGHTDLTKLLDGTSAEPTYLLQPVEPDKTGLFVFGIPGTDFMSPIATFDIDWEALPGQANVKRSIIVSSTDGVHVAVDDPDAIVRETLGLDADRHVAFSIAPERIAFVNGQIILPATITTVAQMASGASTGREIILVGTPN